MFANVITKYIQTDFLNNFAAYLYMHIIFTYATKHDHKSLPTGLIITTTLSHDYSMSGFI